MSHPFKQITPTDHFGWHAAYLPVYHRLFEPLRFSGDEFDRMGRLLEIGTDGGGGLLMYADYFRNNFEVIGMDINPAPSGIIGHPKITHHQCDAYTSGAVARLSVMGEFDVMIEDGNHQLDAQQFFCRNYPQLLSGDGLAIIEDVQDISNFAKLNDALPAEFFGYGIDLRHHDARYDNLLFIIQRR